MNARRPTLSSTHSRLGAKTAGGLKYRDYAFPDGYTFRQYKEDDSILIVKSPRGAGGQLLTEDNPKTQKAWQAIDQRIREHREGKAQAFTRTGLLAVETVLTLLKPAPRRERQRREEPLPPVEETSFPWVPVGIAAAVVAALAAFA